MRRWIQKKNPVALLSTICRAPRRGPLWVPFQSRLHNREVYIRYSVSICLINRDNDNFVIAQRVRPDSVAYNFWPPGFNLYRSNARCKHRASRVYLYVPGGEELGEWKGGVEMGRARWGRSDVAGRCRTWTPKLWHISWPGIRRFTGDAR